MDIPQRLLRPLEEIREELGLPKSETQFRLRHIDQPIDDIDIVGDTGSQTGMLVQGNHPVFVYIRDNTAAPIGATAEEYRRLHFTWCVALQKMKDDNRIERYQVTNREDDRYRIDLPGQVEREEFLKPCKYCLEKTKYGEFRFYMSREEKDQIVKEFCAKDYMRYSRDVSYTNSKLRNESKGLSQDFVRSDYPSWWNGKARQYKEKQNYVCEAHRLKRMSSDSHHRKYREKVLKLPCLKHANGVALREYPHLLDCHHINGRKSDVSEGNLACLCKECHTVLHTHYFSLVGSDVHRVRYIRKEQNGKPSQGALLEESVKWSNRVESRK